jgi:predicted DsbA family dithiol-disulfide isomerase
VETCAFEGAAISRARGRGRFFLMYELIFPLTATFLGRRHHNRVMAHENEVLSSAARSPEMAADAVIEVVSDVVCPWCFIGKRRLEKALKLLERQDLQIQWRAFELNPDISKAGVDRQEHRIRKFGSLVRARQLEAHVAAAGAEEGIEFHFDRIERMPNTFDAHRLIWLAGRDGLQNALVERLFQAYFIDGENVGNHAVLKRIAKQSGLDSSSVDRLLDGDLGVEETRAEENRARVEGVNGVPTFFVSGVPITSGAHKPQVLATLLGPALEPTSQQCSLDDAKCG